MWLFLSLLLVAAVGVAAYSNTFSVPFLFDDEQAIATNNITKELSRIFAGHGLHYNPRRIVGYLTLALNYRYGGLDVTGYHVVNLVIHITSAFLVYALAAVTLKTPFFVSDPMSPERRSLPPASALIPLVAALLFVAHPVQTQAVTYIVQRFASLATLFYLAAVVCYARGRLVSVAETQAPAVEGRRFPSGRWWRRSIIVLWFLLAVLMAALAILTKEIAVTLPAAVLLYECCFFGSVRKKLVRVFWITVTLAAAAGLFLLLTHRLGGFFAAINNLTLQEADSISRTTYFITQLTVITRYLRLLILPINQQILYDYPLHHSLLDVDVLLSSLLLGSLLALSGWFCFRSGTSTYRSQAPWARISPSRRMLRIAGFGGIWFFLTLSVESSVIAIRDVIFEHRLYLPSVGIFLAAAAAAASFPDTRRVRMFAAIVGVGVVVTLASVTYLRNETWRDPVRLWRDNVDKSPSNFGACQSLGVALQRNRDYQGAIQAYLRCLSLNAYKPEIYNNLGAAYNATGFPDKAAEMYSAALRYAPEHWPTWLNLGGAYIRKGDYPAAEIAIKSAIRFSPQRMEGHYHLGYLYELQGRYDEAEKEYREALSLDPSYALAWKGLGNVCRAQGRTGEALEYTNRGAALERQGGDIYYGISPPGQ
jgi:tetratricopeptide (TPR) repeat protein